VTGPLTVETQAICQRRSSNPEKQCSRWSRTSQTLRNYSDVSWVAQIRTAKSSLLVWPASERPNGVQDRGINARACEIFQRPVRVLEHVVEDCGAQLGHLASGPRACATSRACVR
jgi:hypothetical protein